MLLSFLSFSRIAQQLSRPILYGLSLLMGSVFLVMYAFPTTKRLKPARFAHAHCSNGFPEIYRTQSNTYVLPSLILYYEKKMGGNRVWCSNFAFFFLLFALGKWQLALRIEIILGIMVVQGLSDVDLYIVKSWQLFTSSWQFLCRRSRRAKERLDGVNVILKYIRYPPHIMLTFNLWQREKLLAIYFVNQKCFPFHEP